MPTTKPKNTHHSSFRQQRLRTLAALSACALFLLAGSALASASSTGGATATSVSTTTATTSTTDQPAPKPKPQPRPLVRLHIKLSAPGLVSAGQTVLVRGRVSSHRHVLVTLQRRSGHRWVRVRSVLASQHAFRLHLRLSRHTTLRALVSAPDSGRSRPRYRYRNGISRPVHLRVGYPALASWYGDYGGPLACGGTLGYNQMGVAHKHLPCGTRVLIRYHGRTVKVPVIDRGPYVGGREYDLSGATARALHFDGVGTILAAPSR